MNGSPVCSCAPTGQRCTDASRGPESVGAEVARRGHVLEQLTMRHRLVGVQQCVHADEPVLIEVVVGHDVGIAMQAHAGVDVAERHLCRQVSGEMRVEARDARPVREAEHCAGVR